MRLAATGASYTTEMRFFDVEAAPDRPSADADGVTSRSSGPDGRPALTSAATGAATAAESVTHARLRHGAAREPAGSQQGNRVNVKPA